MKNLSTVLLIVSILLGEPIFAKPPPRKAASAPKSHAIQIRTVFGDKETQFSLIKLKEGGKLEYSNNEGRKGAASLNAVDYLYLEKRLRGLKGTNERRFCTRTYVEIELPKRNVIGCLGSGNALANEIQEILNLMALLF